MITFVPLKHKVMKIGFIGTGKIASAVVEGICTSGAAGYEIYLSPRNRQKSESLARDLGQVRRCETNQEVLDSTDIVFIALRPDICRDVIRELNFDSRHTVVSLIPYLRHTELSQLLLPVTRVSRAIPLPTVIYHNCPIPLFRPAESVMEIFSNIGRPFEVVDEDHLHTLWTLTGLITPFYDMLGELSGWSESKGVEHELAARYVADMFSSLSFASSRMIPTDFRKLSDHAATPGGMNEASGVSVRERGAHQAYIEAAEAIFRRFAAI